MASVKQKIVHASAALAVVFSAQAFANGSDTGHNNGNGHHGHHGGDEIENQNIIHSHADGAEVDVTGQNTLTGTVSPNISVGGPETDINNAIDNNLYVSNPTSVGPVTATTGDNTIDLGGVHVGGPEIDVHDTTNLGVEIADHDTTNVHVAGPEIDDRDTTNVHVGGPEIDDRDTTNVHVGGDENEQTVKVTQEGDEVSQENQQTVGPTTQTVGPTTQGQTVSDTSQTTLDARDQSVDNSVNKIDARRGDATNVARAEVRVAKKCVSSFALGVSGGDVFGNYGGISFSYVPSEGVKINDGYTIRELHQLPREQRSEIMDDMSSKGRKITTCLMDQWDLVDAKSQHQQKIQALVNDGNATVEAIRQAGAVAVIGQKHECNQAVAFEQDLVDGKVVRGKVVKDTLAYNVVGKEDEHGECEKNTTKALDFILSH